MDYEVVKFWLDIFQTVLLFAVSFTAFFWKKQAATTSTIETMKDKLLDMIESLSIRLARVEQDVQHAPKHTDLEKLYQRMDTLVRNHAESKADLAEIKGELKHLSRDVVALRQNEIDRQRSQHP